MDDVLFFKVFRNVFLKRKILFHIQNQFIDFTQSHLANRKPYDQIYSLKWMLEKRLYSIIKDKILSNSIIIIDATSIDNLIKFCKDFEIYQLLFNHRRGQIECVNLIKRSIQLDSIFALDSFLKLYENDENGLNKLLKIEYQDIYKQDVIGNDQDKHQEKEIIEQFKLNEIENINVWMMNYSLENSKLQVSEWILNNRELPKPEKEGLLYRGAKILHKLDAVLKPDATLDFIIEKMNVNLELLVQSTKSSSLLPSVLSIAKMKKLEYRLAFLRNRYLRNSPSSYQYDQLKETEKNQLTIDYVISALLFKYNKKSKSSYEAFVQYLSELPGEEMTIEKILDDHKNNVTPLYVNHYFYADQLDKVGTCLTNQDNMLMLFYLSLKNFSIDGLELFFKHFQTSVSIPRGFMENSIPIIALQDIRIKSDKQVVDFILYISELETISISWITIFQIFQQCYPIELFDKVKSVYIKKRNKTFVQFIQDSINYDFLKPILVISNYKNQQIDVDYLDFYFNVLTSQLRYRYRMSIQTINCEKNSNLQESLRVLEYLIDKHQNQKRIVFSWHLSFYDFVIDNFLPTHGYSLSLQESLKYYQILNSSQKVISFIQNYRWEIIKQLEFRTLENIYFLKHLEILFFNKILTLPTGNLLTNSNSYGSNTILSDISFINGNNDQVNSIDLESIILIFKTIYNLNDTQLSILYQQLSSIVNDDNVGIAEKICNVIVYLFKNKLFGKFDLKFINKWLDHLVNIYQIQESQVLIIIKSIYQSIELQLNYQDKIDKNILQKDQQQDQNQYQDEIELNQSNENLLGENYLFIKQFIKTKILDFNQVFLQQPPPPPQLPPIQTPMVQLQLQQQQQQQLQAQPPQQQSSFFSQTCKDNNYLVLKTFLLTLKRKLISLNLYWVFKYLYDRDLLVSNKSMNDSLLEYQMIRHSSSNDTINNFNQLNLKIISGNFENLENDIENCKKSSKTITNGYNFSSYRTSFDAAVLFAAVEQFDRLYKVLYCHIIQPNRLVYEFFLKGRFDLFEFYSKSIDYSIVIDDRILNAIVDNGECNFFHLLLKKFKVIFNNQININNNNNNYNNSISSYNKIKSPIQIFKNSLSMGHIEITKLVIKYFSSEYNFESKINKQFINQLIIADRMNSIQFLFEIDYLIDLGYLFKSSSIISKAGIWKINIFEISVSIINKILLIQQRRQKYIQEIDGNALQNSKQFNHQQKKSQPQQSRTKKRNNLIIDSLATTIVLPNGDSYDGSKNTSNDQPLKRQRTKKYQEYNF